MKNRRSPFVLSSAAALTFFACQEDSIQTVPLTDEQLREVGNQISFLENEGRMCAEQIIDASTVSLLTPFTDTDKKERIKKYLDKAIANVRNVYERKKIVGYFIVNESEIDENEKITQENDLQHSLGFTQEHLILSDVIGIHTSNFEYPHQTLTELLTHEGAHTITIDTLHGFGEGSHSDNIHSARQNYGYSSEFTTVILNEKDFPYFLGILFKNSGEIREMTFNNLTYAVSYSHDQIQSGTWTYSESVAYLQAKKNEDISDEEAENLANSWHAMYEPLGIDAEKLSNILKNCIWSFREREWEKAIAEFEATETTIETKPEVEPSEKIVEKSIKMNYY